MDLLDVTDVPLMGELRYQFNALWRPQITLLNWLAPVWVGEAAPRSDAIAVMDARLLAFRAAEHNCNGCHRAGAGFVDMATIEGSGLDEALFYCSEGCADDTEREANVGM